MSTSHLRHTLSFVNHDLYGPTAMLRNYLHAVGLSAAEHADLADMMRDAEELAMQLEGLLRILQDTLRLQIGNLDLAPEPVSLRELVERWWEANPGAAHGAVAEVPPARLDPAAAARMLDYAAFQVSRMGDGRGEVEVGCGLCGSRPALRIARLDGRLSVETLSAAALSPHEDWERTLRRLPACGLPLRTALAICLAQGGEVSVEKIEPTGAVLVLAFAAAANESQEGVGK
jgi:K+-sensing histidine kinase KdpD